MERRGFRVGPPESPPAAAVCPVRDGLILALALAGAIGVLAARTQAADSNWIVSAGDWSDANNWSAGEPNASATATIENGGTASITQAGQCFRLRLGSFDSLTPGTVNLNSGSFSLRYLYVYSGAFVQSDGSVNAWGDPLSFNPGQVQTDAYPLGSATYQLIGPGNLAAFWEVAGWIGTGTFVQTDGNNHAYELFLGYRAGSYGVFLLSGKGIVTADAYVSVGMDGNAYFGQSGGMLSTPSMDIGRLGRYDLTGGTLQVTGSISNDGVFEISDGNLDVGNLYIGENHGGSLLVAGAPANIRIYSRLSIGVSGNLSAVPGSTVYMTGSVFQNQSTDANSLAGLGNLALIFEGGDANLDPFEVAGMDLGADPNGFLGNFGLGTLELGGPPGAGRVMLVDLFDNRKESNAPEALYVQNLTVNPGSELWLNGLHLYVNGALVNAGDGGLYGGGEIFVPEPATMVLLALGGAAMLRRRRGFGRPLRARAFRAV